MKRTYLTCVIFCMAMLLLLFRSIEVQAQDNNAEVITSGDFQYEKIGMTDLYIMK